MSMSWEPPRRYTVIKPTFAAYATDHDHPRTPEERIRAAINYAAATYPPPGIRRIVGADRAAYIDLALTEDYANVPHNTRSLDEHYNTLPEGVRK